MARFNFMLTPLCLLISLAKAAPHVARATCTIPAHGNGTDDTPAILAAFEECGHGGHIIFNPDTTYNIATVMNTTSLSDVVIDIHGTLLWSKDLDYWLNNSLSIGYQNQSSAWFLGGTNIHVNGHGTGTLDGNGQAWYDLVQGISNYPNRPMGLTIWGANDSTFEGLHFRQSQMWTMAIIYSNNLLMQDITVNSTTHTRAPARNTDGADTMYSDNITMRRWDIDNGDDGISLKGNSTNVLVEDCIFRRGQGFAMGSIGQYADRFEVIENVVVRNITNIETKYAAYVKTWTGEQSGEPPNGGGGGTGRIRNITITDVTLDQGRASPFTITQCTAFGGQTRGDCDSSTFKISDISLTNVRGSVDASTVAIMQCSAAAGGCDDIRIEDVVVENIGSSANATYPNAYRYLCSNVVEPEGFACTGRVTTNPGGS